MSSSTDSAVRFQGGLDVDLALPAAGFGSRAAAWILDWLVLLLVWLCLVLVTLLSVGVADMSPVVLGGLVVAWFAVQWFAIATQEVLMSGQTFGKRAVGIRVVTEDGLPPDVLRCLVRNLLRPIDSLPFAGGIAAVLITSTSRRVRLGDLLAGTRVAVDPPTITSSGPTKLPHGATAKEVQVLQAWAARHKALHPPAQEAVAQKLAGWLDARFPGHLPDEGTPAARLHTGLGVEP